MHMKIAIVCRMQGAATGFSSRQCRMERTEIGPHDFGITKREIEVMQMLTQELATKEIADKMCISENTVTGYRKSLFQKFEVRNMVGLVKYALKNNLINP